MEAISKSELQQANHFCEIPRIWVYICEPYFDYKYCRQIDGPVDEIVIFNSNLSENIHLYYNSKHLFLILPDGFLLFPISAENLLF